MWMLTDGTILFEPHTCVSVTALYKLSSIIQFIIIKRLCHDHDICGSVTVLNTARNMKVGDQNERNFDVH